MNALQLLEFRPAVLDDARDVAGLFAQLGYGAEDEVMAARLAAVLGTDGHWCGVAAAGPSVVACLHVFAAPILEAGRVAQVAGLIVDAAWRRRGVGRRLVAEAEEWARQCGCGRMYVRTNILRDEAHAFYEGLGYHRAKTQYAYRKSLAPEVP